MEVFSNLNVGDKAEFKKNESKWWNGHAYLPLFNYYLNYNYLNGEVKIHYEFRQSEFSKPSMIDGGAFGDRHNYQMQCRIKTENKYSDFSIFERGILAKLLNKSPDLLYNVKCSDEQLKDVLENSNDLNEIFIIVENSPEFSPLIVGSMKNGNYELNVSYSNQQADEISLRLMNNFCKSIIEFCTNDKTVG